MFINGAHIFVTIQGNASDVNSHASVAVLALQSRKYSRNSQHNGWWSIWIKGVKLGVSSNLGSNLLEFHQTPNRKGKISQRIITICRAFRRIPLINHFLPVVEKNDVRLTVTTAPQK